MANLINFKVPVLLIGTFFLCSCKFNNLKSKRPVLRSAVLETEARYGDIPLPLDIISFKEIENGFEYTSKEQPDVFYQKVMELYGWRLFAAQDNILIYEKPHKAAVVNFSTKKNVYSVKVLCASKR